MKLYNTLSLCKHKTLNLFHSLEDPKLLQESLSACQSAASLGCNVLKSSEGFITPTILPKEGDEEHKLSPSRDTEPSTFVGGQLRASAKNSGTKQDDEHCYLLNRRLGLSAYNLKHKPAYKDVSMTIVVPHKNFQVKNNKISVTKMPNQKLLKNKIRKERKELISLQSKARGQHMYLQNMKKMVKMVSTIIYYHIIHSHGQSDKPSKLANLFNQKKIFEDLGTESFIVVDSFGSTSSSIVVHRDRVIPKVKIDADFNKYKIYEFLEVVIGSLSLHLECVLLSLVYLETLMTKKGCEIRMSNWRPLLLTCLILACKYWEEGGYWNSDFSEITSFPIDVINDLESKALELLEYKLFISSHLYSQYYMEVRALYKKVRKEEQKNKMKKQYKKYGVKTRKATKDLIN